MTNNLNCMDFTTSKELKTFCKNNNIEIVAKNPQGKMRDNGKYFDIYHLSNNEIYYIRCGW